MVNEEEYKKETGKEAFYNNSPTDTYKKWLELREMEEAIKMVLEHEKNGG